MQKDLSYDITTLLKQVTEEDEKAFRLIFDHYKAPFHTAAFKMRRSADIVLEITQEVFVILRAKMKLVAKKYSSDARNKNIQSRINSIIEFRESFRPFVPAILQENANDYIHLDIISPLYATSC
ncbi:MAG: carbamoyltransferase C-terminal domain-containing protein [Ginsengibacter sp.]